MIKQQYIIDALGSGLNDPVFNAARLPHAKSSWRDFEKMLDGKTAIQKMNLVNQLWNRASYKSDQNVYGKDDYWVTPGEFSRKGGDCEDYAIAKYLSLRKLGFDAGDMRILVVKDNISKQAHAVLAVWEDGKVYILDNLNPKLMTDQEVAGRYMAISSINENARWGHIHTKASASARELVPESMDDDAPAAGMTPG